MRRTIAYPFCAMSRRSNFVQSGDNITRQSSSVELGALFGVRPDALYAKVLSNGTVYELRVHRVNSETNPMAQI